jgi:hypothetical protein
MQHIDRIFDYFDKIQTISGIGSIYLLSKQIDKINKIIILFGDTNHDKKGCKFICNYKNNCIDSYCVVEEIFNILNTPINFYLEDDLKLSELPTDINYVTNSRCGINKINLDVNNYDSLTELQIKYNKIVDKTENIIFHKSDIRYIFFDVPYIKEYEIEYYEVMLFSALVIDQSNLLTDEEFIHDFNHQLQNIDIVRYIWWICNFINDFTDQANIDELFISIKNELKNISEEISIVINKYIDIIAIIIQTLVETIKKTTLYINFNKLVSRNISILTKNVNISVHDLYDDITVDIKKDIINFFKDIKYLQILTYYNDLYTLSKMHQILPNNNQEIIVSYFGYDHVFNMKNILLKCGYTLHKSSYYLNTRSQRKCYQKSNKTHEKISDTIDTVYTAIS